MSQRDSGYARKERDLYETPEWVTRALVPHIPRYVKRVYEPAAGSGKMVKALMNAGYSVAHDDIEAGSNFLELEKLTGFDAIVTNPPYELADKFIDRALQLIDCAPGLVAMLLRTDFDHAKSRRLLFADNWAFDKKIVLTRRIKWFEDSKGSPSFNHAWFVWDFTREYSPPTLAYGPVAVPEGRRK